MRYSPFPCVKIMVFVISCLKIVWEGFPCCKKSCKLNKQITVKINGRVNHELPVLVLFYK